MIIWVVAKSIPGESLEVWGHIKRAGHQVFVGLPDSNQYVTPDVIISTGITSMEDTFKAIDRWPSAMLYCYNWDVYEWVWTHPQGKEYDYLRYGDLLQRADEVWVPSDCTGRRTLQWWPSVKSVHTILSAIPYWDHPSVRDDGYALCCMRKIPDPWWYKFEECCEKLKIPYVITDHQLSQDAYRDMVAGCRFICCHLYECSTGGFSISEAYYLGKPVLLNASEWNGGRDYMRSNALYFNANDTDDFKIMLQHIMYEKPVQEDSYECRKYMTDNFSDSCMAERILARIKQ